MADQAENLTEEVPGGIRIGAKYRVEFTACCLQGSYEGILEVVQWCSNEECPSYKKPEALKFSGGLVLTNWRQVRFVEVEQGVVDGERAQETEVVHV